MSLLFIMTNTEKLLKELDIRLAHFGDAEIATQGSPLPRSIASSDVHRLSREIASKLVFKTE
ncbi:MAG TPA: hypothetical protein VFV92_06535 [Candidatus Bathyarchaeia archaeon]|nr:hypothetical protein [Candidatus Bathyarchaeia archaeon]